MAKPTPAGSVPFAPQTEFFAGLDLGQLHEHTALAIVERTRCVEDGWIVYHHAVRHLQRWPIRSGYPAIFTDVAKRFDRPPLLGAVLIVDRTAVGVAVFELLRRIIPSRTVLLPATITGGDQVTAVAGAFAVPKRELAGTLQALLGTRRLQVSPALPLAAELAREMSTFKVKINVAPAGETYEAWRERPSDDVVLATALACWCGEQVGDEPDPCGSESVRVYI